MVFVTHDFTVIPARMAGHLDAGADAVIVICSCGYRSGVGTTSGMTSAWARHVKDRTENERDSNA